MKKYDFIVIGGMTEDLSFSVDDYVLLDSQNDLPEKILGFEYGSKIGIKDVQIHFGGGAANVSVALARLGFKSAIVSAVGDDEAGRRIINNLVKHKVDTRYIQMIEKEKSGLSLVLKTLSGEHVLFTYRGSNDKLKINHKLTNKLSGAKRLYLTSLTGNWRQILEVIFSVKRPVAWNPGRKQLAAGFNSLKKFLAVTDVLILNRDEATELVVSATKISRLWTVGMMLKKLRSFGPRLVVITEGKKGAQAFDGRKVYIQKATDHKALDTTGVGDAFGSTFVAAFDYHNNIKLALKLAMRNSSSVVTKPGAQHGLLSKSQLGF